MIDFKNIEKFSIESGREDDERRVEQRLKQIKFGKNTIGYDRYIATIPKYLLNFFLIHILLFNNNFSFKTNYKSLYCLFVCLEMKEKVILNILVHLIHMKKFQKELLMEE